MLLFEQIFLVLLSLLFSSQSSLSGLFVNLSIQVTEVDVFALAAALEAGTVPVLVDVRTPAEYANGHVPLAINIPVDELPGRMDELSAYRDVSLYVICQSGGRSPPYTRLPVYRESIDDVIGAVNTRDLIPHLLSSIGAETELKDLLRPVVTVPEGMTADRLITAMREAGVKLAIVKDEFGGTSGLVTLEDVLAEILGDVADEFSAAELVPERFADGSFRLPGSMRLDEVEEWLGVEWEGTAATVGGYITDLFGHLPSPGEQVEIHSHVVEIERVSSKLVVSVMVTPSLREKPEADHG